jgi:hypothetical protein
MRLEVVVPPLASLSLSLRDREEERVRKRKSAQTFGRALTQDAPPDVTVLSRPAIDPLAVSWKQACPRRLYMHTGRAQYIFLDTPVLNRT